MDIREFSTKLAEATRDMTPAERQAIQKMFQGMSEQITKEDPAPASCASGCKDGYAGTADHGTAIPEGPTERILALKRQYMSLKPSITTHRTIMVNHQDLQRESGNAEDPASRKMFPLLL